MTFLILWTLYMVVMGVGMMVYGVARNLVGARGAEPICRRCGHQGGWIVGEQAHGYRSGTIPRDIGEVRVVRCRACNPRGLRPIRWLVATLDAWRRNREWRRLTV